MSDLDERIVRERRRIRDEYARRQREVPADRYASDDPAEAMARVERRRLAEDMLRSAGAFPDAHAPCLEIGCGSGGWLPDLHAWGVDPLCLHGVDLDAGRVAVARTRLPGAPLHVADAALLPYAAASFRLVVASTVFSSILDADVQQRLGAEIERVLAPGGAFLIYDFAVDNPHNPHVRGVPTRAIHRIVPHLRGAVRSLTLAPPLARRVAPRSPRLARLLARVPFLRTHRLGVLVR